MYFPESESKNGWKSLKNKKNINLEKLDIEINRQQVFLEIIQTALLLLKMVAWSMNIIPL
mgnify:CR=1 FL=1